MRHSEAARGRVLGGQNLAAFSAAAGQNFTASFGGHAGTETVAAGTNEV